MKNSCTCDHNTFMGQIHSSEMSDKVNIELSPTSEIYVPPLIQSLDNKADKGNQPFKSTSKPNKYLLIHYQNQFKSPLHTFISGFHQQNTTNMHIFFKLSYDTIYRIAEYAKGQHSKWLLCLDWKIMPYTGEPDTKGIIHWIRYLNDENVCMNPITQNLIHIISSYDYHVNYSRDEDSVSRVLEYPPLSDKDCYFDPGCVIFHFPYHKIHPTGYTFRNGGGRGSVVRKWLFEGSTSLNGPWILLSDHSEDDTFFYDVTDGRNKENSFLAHCWPIGSKEQNKMFFSYFRIRSLHTHPNGRSHALYISGFELYGIVKWNHK